MLLAPLLGMPLPLLPLQILWINLVTDGLPALALGLEPAERSTMQRPPQHPNENIFSRGLGARVLGLGLLTGLVALGVGFGYWATGRAGWQTMIFTTLTLAQMALALGLRTDRDALWRVGLWTNKPLLGAVGLTVALQAALVYVPFLQGVFHTTPLAAAGPGAEPGVERSGAGGGRSRKMAAPPPDTSWLTPANLKEGTPMQAQILVPLDGSPLAELIVPHAGSGRKPPGVGSPCSR